MNQDLLEEAGSDILELNTDLTLISDHQPVPTDYDTIKDLVNELIDRVDKQSQESRSVSRSTNHFSLKQCSKSFNKFSYTIKSQLKN